MSSPQAQALAVPPAPAPLPGAPWPRIPVAVTTTLAWAAGTLVYATHLYLYHRLQKQPDSFTLELGEAAAHFGVWALLTPVVLGLAARADLLDRRWPRRLAHHLPLALGLAALQLLLHTLLDHLLLHAGGLDLAAFAARLRGFFARTYYANVAVYFALVLGSNGLDLAQRRKSREAELERHLAQAQLDSLRRQLQPHFLFNALNAVSALIADDPTAAQRMVARLGELLRLALNQGSAAEVPLSRELELARCYLAIEQVRFGDRLHVDVEVEPGTEGALVPGLLLQPLLENAVRHGIARRPGPGRIEVRVRAAGGRLRLQVRDDGEGLGAAGGGAAGGGLGLANAQARLAGLYGAAQSLELRPLPGGGTEVVVELPLRRPPAPGASS